MVFADDWGRHPSSCQHLIRQLGVYNRILWVNAMGMRAPRLALSDAKRLIQKIAAWLSTSVNGEQLTGSMSLLCVPSIPCYGLPGIRRINAQVGLRAVQREMGKRGFTDPIVITAHPTMVDFVGRLGEQAFIYYCVDEFAEYPGLPTKTIMDMETELLQKADLVIVTSFELQRRKTKAGREPRLLPHGVDVEHFAKALNPRCPKPREMDGIKQPIIGFFGLVSKWVDLRLIDRMAQLRKDWSWVLIGPVETNVSSLRDRPNVALLGKVNYEDLPSYASLFDVGIIPFVVNELTVNVNPLKLLEYLACGLPVVSTPLPEVARYGKLVSVADTAESFIAAIEKAMDENSASLQQERLSAAAGASWNHKAEEFSLLIESVLSCQRVHA